MKIITNGINNSGLLALLSLAIVLAAVYAYIQRDAIVAMSPIVSDQGRIALPATSTPAVDQEQEEEGVVEIGVYQEYSEERTASVPATAQTVLFFHSTRCPSCHEVDRALNSDVQVIPPDVFIFKVDYDRSLELRRQFGVTTPHTFVELDNLGRLVQRWTGSMSLQSILARL